MTPLARGQRVAQQVLEEIVPRMARWLGPVDLERLAQLVAKEVEAAVAEDREPLWGGEVAG